MSTPTKLLDVEGRSAQRRNSSQEREDADTRLDFSSSVPLCPAAAQAETRGRESEAVCSVPAGNLLGDHPIQLVLDFSKRKCDFYRKIDSIWEKGLIKPQKDNTFIQQRIQFICHKLKSQSPLGTQLLF